MSDSVLESLPISVTDENNVRDEMDFFGAKSLSLSSNAPKLNLSSRRSSKRREKVKPSHGLFSTALKEISDTHKNKNTKKAPTRADAAAKDALRSSLFRKPKLSGRSDRSPKPLLEDEKENFDVFNNAPLLTNAMPAHLAKKLAQSSAKRTRKPKMTLDELTVSVGGGDTDTKKPVLKKGMRTAAQRRSLSVNKRRTTASVFVDKRSSSVSKRRSVASKPPASSR